MTDSEIIAVVSAHKEGKKIQYRDNELKYINDQWHEVLPTHIGFDFRRLTYRVAPEPRKPREFWLYPVKYGMYYALDKYDDGSPGVSQIHVREVLE